jgi:hypothetical protein
LISDMPLEEGIIPVEVHFSPVATRSRSIDH